MCVHYHGHCKNTEFCCHLQRSIRYWKFYVLSSMLLQSTTINYFLLFLQRVKKMVAQFLDTFQPLQMFRNNVSTFPLKRIILWGTTEKWLWHLMWMRAVIPLAFATKTQRLKSWFWILVSSCSWSTPTIYLISLGTLMAPGTARSWGTYMYIPFDGVVHMFLIT